jgi:DNA-binding ferritin-like protein (Dps family)
MAKQSTIDAIKKIFNEKELTQQQSNDLNAAIDSAVKSSDTTKKNSSEGDSLLTKLNNFIDALDKSTNSTVQWNTSVLKMGDAVVKTLGNIVGKDSSFADVLNGLAGIASPFLEVDQALRNQVNKELGLTGRLSRDIRTSIIEASEGTLEFGIGTEHITKLYTSFVTQLGRAVPLSKELLQNTSMVARASGVSMDEAGKFLANLESFGLSINQGPKVLEEMSDTARSLGLSTTKFMSYAAENLKLINTLGFEKGVRGFTEIAAKASLIGFNLQSAAGVAEKLFDIDSAVEMAAQLNVLGGDFGKLGNAIDLMFAPTNGIEGFTNDLMKATKEFVTFNAEKNTFDVSPLDLRRAREFAKATGLSLEEVIESGKRLSKMEMIKDRISILPNLSDEERDLIGSLGQLNKDGQVTIKGQTVTKLMEDGKLTSAINGLKQEGAKSDRSQKDILNEQLNIFSKSNFFLKQIALKLGAFGDDAGLFNVLGNDLNDFVYQLLGENSKESEDLIQKIAMAVKGQDASGFNEVFNTIKNSKELSQRVVDLNLTDSLNKLKTSVSTYVDGVIANNNRVQEGYGTRLANAESNQNVTVEAKTNLTIVMDGKRYQLTTDQWKAIEELTKGAITRITTE